MLVMKFGGTSVESAEAINRLVSIVSGRLERKPVLVVSALSKVTNTLYEITDLIEKNQLEEALAHLDGLKERHLGVLEGLVTTSSEHYAPCAAMIESTIAELGEFLTILCKIGEISERSSARIYSTGEVLSSQIICAALNHNGIATALMDARQIIITDSNYTKGTPIVAEICERAPRVIEKAYQGNQAVITQGFLSATAAGITTVLGRGGSDYSASLIGMAVGAEEIEIWTDVDGIFSADPRRVSNSSYIEKISFEEASEMAQFGAKVLHPFTILPAIEKNIPVRVLNSKNPTHCGTIILQDSEISPSAKSVSFKENITVINIYSTSMINTFGFLSKVFEIFNRHHISVDLISTSEANISLTIEQGQDITSLMEELSTFSKVEIQRDKSQISVIGKGLIDIKGLCTKVFASLIDYKIYMISQGASAINLSFVVKREHLDDILNKLHNEIF